jgi:hypothetical protein
MKKFEVILPIYNYLQEISNIESKPPHSLCKVGIVGKDPTFLPERGFLQ